MKKELKHTRQPRRARCRSGRSPDEEGTETSREAWCSPPVCPAEVLMKKELKHNSPWSISSTNGPAEVLMKKELKLFGVRRSNSFLSPAEVLMKKELKLSCLV